MSPLTLGILGGGQLGRMSALAAARLGISCVIYTSEQDSPASQVVAQTFVASYDDQDALKAFAEAVDVISYEFENIPLETIRFLKKLKPVYPDERLLEMSQDRIAEKSFLNEIGIPTTRWVAIETADDIRAALKDWHSDKGIVKTTRFGYDGKGQAWVNMNDSLEDVFEQFKGQALILEKPVDFACEISAIICRDQQGNTQTYGPMLNHHKNHILDRSLFPADISQDTAHKALESVQTLAQHIDLTGLLTLEMFVTQDGDILANEIAPRTHNSGHWTIDACAVSQFENHVRTVCGLPVGAPAPHSAAKMINLIGDDIDKIDQYVSKPGACIHIYGKKETRPGRKMGHVTRIKDQDKAV